MIFIPKVLIVENEPGWQQNFNKHLSSQNWILSTAWNANEAVKMIRENKYFALVQDLKIPKVSDGIQVLNQWIKSYPENTNVIIISAFLNSNVIAQLATKGVTHFFQKVDFVEEHHELIDLLEQFYTKYKKELEKDSLNKSRVSFETDKTIIQSLVMGDNIQFSGSGNIAFGKDNANINQTNFDDHHNNNDNDLMTKINQLKDEISKLNIDKVKKEAMSFQIEVLESQSTHDKINPVIIKTALDNLNKIAIGAIGSAAGSSLFELIKRIGMIIV